MLVPTARPAIAQTAKPAPPSRIAQAEALYAKRSDLSHLREAIRLLQQARAADAKDFEAVWRLAKFSYYLAAHTSDERERDRTFKSGIDAGVAAVALQATRPEGHFWHGANIGGRAKARGGISAFNSVDDVRKEMRAVIKIDPSYQGGSAYMILGQIDLQVPGLFGGNKKRAVEELEKGLTFGEGNALLRVQLATAYQAAHRDVDARRQIDAVLTMKPDPDYLPEYKEASAEAKRLLDELKKQSPEPTTTKPDAGPDVRRPESAEVPPAT